MFFISRPFLLAAHVLIGSAAAAATLTTRDILTTECAAPSSAQLAASKAAFVTVAPLGDVAAIYLSDSSSLQTRLYYQQENGNILQHTIAGGPFTTGNTFSLNVLVESNLTRRGTPIAASGSVAQGFHVYYVTPSCTLAEMRFVPGTGWQGASAAACSQCINNANFVVAEGSQVLYAIQDPNNANVLRVGFESVGAPGTISEAVTTNFGRTWQIAPAPDSQE